MKHFSSEISVRAAEHWRNVDCYRVMRSGTMSGDKDCDKANFFCKKRFVAKNYRHKLFPKIFPAVAFLSPCCRQISTNSVPDQNGEENFFPEFVLKILHLNFIFQSNISFAIHWSLNI